MVQFSGATAPSSPSTHDQIAFCELARLGSRLNQAFHQNSVDRAIDRLIANPVRKTSGTLLANRLFKDAKKYLRRKHRREFLQDDLETENRSVDQPTQLDLNEISLAVETIRSELMALTAREQQVLMTRTLDAPPETVGVGRRQFDRLLSGTRARLRENAAIEDAKRVVMDALNKWRWETIDLLKPLAACLTIKN